jgi:hypothetical protein
MEFTLYQVIAYLSKVENWNRKFKRVNDEKFIIFKGSYNDLMMQVGDIIRPLPVFNYLVDKWLLIEEQE